jgi:hypothetical protein
MRSAVMTLTALVVFLAASAAPAQMQHPMPSPQPQPGGEQQMPHHSGMMMCPMMGMMGGMQPGGMMGPGMMGMMMGFPDPKAMGRMLRMRGEMMKAMGDIMMKHGAELEQGK